MVNTAIDIACQKNAVSALSISAIPNATETSCPTKAPMIKDIAPDLMVVISILASSDKV